MERIGRERGEKDYKRGKSRGKAREVSKREKGIWRWESKSENSSNLDKAFG